MVSYGVDGAADAVGIECGWVSTGCGSGGASFESELGGASAGSESGGASAGSATVGTPVVGDVVAAVDGAGPGINWGPPLPQLGLVGEESVLQGGTLERPVYLDGSESRGMKDDQTLLRGGYLKKPHLFTELLVVQGMQFIPLEKNRKGCACTSQVRRQKRSR